VDGLKDIESKTLRTVGEPKKRFEEDALRIARLIRFSVQLDFNIEQESLSAAISHIESLKLVSKERVFAEFQKMLKGCVNLVKIDQVFKTNLSQNINVNTNLSFFEKAYIADFLSKVLHVDAEDYLLEKKIKTAFKTLKALLQTESLQEDFIRACDKFSLYEEEQVKLWGLIETKRQDAKNIKVAAYSKNDVSAASLKLRKEFTGAELGAALFKFKVERFFCG